MFVRIKKSGTYQYLQIVENFREGNSVRQRVIGTLGRLEELAGTRDIDSLISKLSKYSKQVLMILCGESQINAQAISVGPALVFERLWNELGISSIIKELSADYKFTFPVERAIFLTVLNRLFESGSDRKCEKWKTGVYVEGAEQLSLHHLYRAMNFLGRTTWDQRGKTPFISRCNKDIIEEKLFQRRLDLFTSLDLVFFDTTSIYFEGNGGDEMGFRGHSKDSRPDLNQMVVGAVLNNDGEPICCELWPGNTTDVITLLPVTDRIRERFGVKNFCIVADRGMISSDTIKGLEQREMSYILGARMRKQKIIGQEVLTRGGRFAEVRNENNVDNHDPLKVKEVIACGKRYIVCMNDKQARKDAATRQAILETLEEKVKTDPKSLVGNKGFKKYLSIKKGSVTIDPKKIEADKRFDGKWVLQTNVSLPASDVALKYKELWQVEQVFRDVKSILETRPIYHQTDENIRGHVFCSFLALILKKELDKRLSKISLDYEWNDITRDLLALQEVVIEDGIKKVAIRTKCNGVSSGVFKAVGVAMPPSLKEIK